MEHGAKSVEKTELTSVSPGPVPHAPCSTPSACEAGLNAHHPPCHEPCALACPETCALNPPQPVPPIVLEEALERYQREAQQGVCDTGRYRMRYYVWGQGPPLVFIHGVSDSSRAFIQPISRLSAHFRCIAYDQAGMKGDGSRFGRYRHEDLVADLWALLDHLRIERSYVLGSSFGAMITLAAMRQRPERIPRAILQGGLVYRPLRRMERILARIGSWLPGRMKSVPLRRRVAEVVNKHAFAGQPESVWQYFLENCGRTPIATFARQGLIISQLDLRPLLGEVRQPVLLLWGERDRVAGPVHQQMLLEGLPSVGRATLEGCGHVPAYSHPEVMAEAVRVFLTPPG
jgi:pimeloyl-ACP methyl ester carboxylesterase